MKVTALLKTVGRAALAAAFIAFCAAAVRAAVNPYADFSRMNVKGVGVAIVPVRNFEWSGEHRAWRIKGGSGGFIMRFAVPEAGSFNFQVKHLTTLYGDCPNGGYAPVSIQVNGASLAEDFDPALRHGGTHALVTDSWPFRAKKGINEAVFTVSRQCSQYVISRVDIVPVSVGTPSAARDSGRARDHFNNALSELKRGDPTSAIISFNKAVSLDPYLEAQAAPRLAEAYARRGGDLFSRGDYGKAEADLEESLRLNPDSEPARKLLVSARDKLKAAGPISPKPSPAPAAAAASDPMQVTTARSMLVRIAELEELYKRKKGSYTTDPWYLAKFFGDKGDFRGQISEVIDPSSLVIELDGEGFRISAALRGMGGARVSVSSEDIPSMEKAPEKPPQNTALATVRARLLVTIFLIVPMALIAFFVPWRRLFRGGAAAGASVPGPRSSPEPAVKEAPRQQSKPAAHQPSAEIPDLVSLVGIPPASSVHSDQAEASVRAGDYNKALAVLNKKPGPQLTLRDYNLFLECYLQLGDAMRAELIFSTIDREIAETHPVLRGPGRPVFDQRRRRGMLPQDPKLSSASLPGAYLALARLAKAKSAAGVSSQLYRLAADCMLTTYSPAAAGREYYELASALDEEGELKLAMELFQAINYQDSAQRCARLKLKAAVAPPPQAAPPRQPQQPAITSSGPATGVSLPGSVLAGRYEVGNPLGAGGMAVIYQGRDRKTGKSVAVKLMHSYLKEYPEEMNRFRKEAQIVEGLQHPNIVGIVELVEQNGELYLVFDYVSGKTLHAVLKEQKRLSLDYCKKVFVGVCDAIHYAHTKNVIHRDLKPGNIMMAGNGEAMVMDFGLSCELRDGLTRVSHQTMSGTPAYMAPEQQAGLVKRETDIYAMGVCLYEMLTGALPFSGEDALRQKQQKDYREASAQLPWLASGVDAVISRALEPEPSQRYADALDFWEALKDL